MTSQWVIIEVGTDAPDLTADFADRVGVYHGVKSPPQNAPSVSCSWYPYLGREIEKDINNVLADLDEKPMAFDVFLVESWYQQFGDWWPKKSWPSGMKSVGEKIRKASYIPGMWTAPFVVHKGSRFEKEHPEWLLRRKDGSLCLFRMGSRNHRVIDPTYPGVCEFLEETYRRLVHDYGFPYQKLDFTRAVFTDEDVQFYDRSATRLQAYRRGMEAIRRGAGPDAYISMCGGHFAGASGLVDAQRSGSDVEAFWSNVTVRFGQNVRRTWMGRLWHVNPDSMMVRKAGKPKLTFTDEKARTGAINQYVGGQMVKLEMYFGKLDDFTRSLYRHIFPSINSPAVVLDPFHPYIPTKLLTRVEPKCPGLAPWVTVAIVNWEDEPRKISLELGEEITKNLHGSKF